MDDELRDRRQRSLWRLLVRANVVHAEAVTRRIHAEGFTELQAGWPRLLGHLDTDGTRIGTIARRAGMTRQAVGQMLDDIERAGCVRRERDPDDARAVRVVFTPRGRAMLECAVRNMAAVEAEHAAVMGEEAWRGFKRGLEAFVAAVDPEPNLQ